MIQAWLDLFSVVLPTSSSISSLSSANHQFISHLYRHSGSDVSIGGDNEGGELGIPSQRHNTLTEMGEEQQLVLIAEQLRTFRQKLHSFVDEVVSFSSSSLIEGSHREGFSMFFHFLGGAGGTVGKLVGPGEVREGIDLVSEFVKILVVLVRSDGEEGEGGGGGGEKKRRLKSRFRFPTGKGRIQGKGKGGEGEKSGSWKRDGEGGSKKKMTKLEREKEQLRDDLFLAKDLLAFLESHVEDPSGAIVGREPCSALLSQVCCCCCV